MRYLTIEEIAAIHERLIEETGGLDGIRDVGLLFSIAEKPKVIIAGEEMYPDVFSKAAALIEALATYHVFVDGNKRTAFLSGKVFLAMNGHDIKLNQDKAHPYMLAIAQRKKNIEQISSWLKKRLK